MEFELYYSAPFAEILNEVYDLEEVPGLSRDPALGIPFFRSRKPFKRGTIFNLPLGFCQSADYFKARWHGSEWPRIKAYAAEHAVNITLTTIGELGIDRGFHSADNPVLFLAAGADPRAGYSSNLRTNLRKEWNKAGRHGIEIVESREPADLRAFYRVLATQYVREHRMVFQPYSLLRKLLGPEGWGRLLVARHRGSIVGGMFLIADGRVLHYNWGARGRIENVSIGTLLIDHTIEYAHDAGYAAFDFGATPLSDADLLAFKMRWGCTNLPVQRYYTTQAPRHVDLNASFAWPRKAYSKLPVGLAERLMPVVVPWLAS